jgi:glycosyltransferase involved in cell wall biosynthesis
MKKVLLIAYYYPPLGGIGSQRSQKFARYLGDYAWTPTVLAPERGSSYIDDSLDDLTTRGVEVIRARAFDLGSMFKRFIPNGSSSASSRAQTKRTGNSLLGALKSAVNTWVYIPDGQVGWYPSALRAGRRVLESQDVEAIWSSSFPMTAHMIACKLKLETGKPWVADFRDLWTENQSPTYSNAVRKRLDRLIESRLIENADALVTVSEELAEKLRRLTGGSKRVEVITNGFDSDDFVGIEHSPQSKWRLTFVGSFYRFSDPSPILTALQRLIGTGAIRREDVQLSLVGATNHSIQDLLVKFGLAEQANFTGFIPHRESLAYQVNSSLLLFPLHGNGASPGIVSGKLFEYLGARRPILAVIPPDFEAARIINEAKAGVTIEPSNIDEIQRQLLASYGAFKAGEDLSFDSTDVSRYERSRGAEQLARLLTELTSA